jgi:phytol kinase
MLDGLSQELSQIDNLGLKAIVVVLWLAIVGGAAVITRRLAPQGSELVRKVVHIGTGHVILIAWWMQIPAWVGIGFSILFSLVAIASYRWPLLPSINNIGRKSWGTCFYAVSIGILTAWFWPIQLPQYAALGILVMTWGDGLAGVIGKRFGRHHFQIWGATKSREGCATMAIVSTIVSLLILLNTQGNLASVWLISGLIGLTAMGLELFSHSGADNLTVPIGSAALAYGLIQVLA